MDNAKIKDVAELAGVSISTVSRVLNSSKRVSPELEEKVRSAAEALNYTQNAIARGLKISKTRTIAVIITEIKRTFFTKVLEGISRIANENNYQIIIMETHDSLEEEIKLVKSCTEQWVDGIILASSAYESKEHSKGYIEMLAGLRKRGKKIPIISLEYQLDSELLEAVSVDYENAAYDAVNHLICEANRNNILHVSLPIGHLIGEKRIAGYVRALKDNGFDDNAKKIVEGRYTAYSGYLAVKQELEMGRRYDGIFCANDQMAVGAMKACQAFELSIPEDVAIIGCDDIFVSSLLNPSLSTLHVPRYRMGVQAMELMLCLLGDKDIKLYKNEVLYPELVRRESTGFSTTSTMDWAELEW